MAVLPIIQTINPFNVKKGVEIFFSYTGGEKLVTGHKMTIKNKESESIVYEKSLQTPYFAHEIGSNVLINGNIYSAIVVLDFIDGTQSEPSEEALFKTMDDPVLDITTIDAEGYVYNSDVTFNVSYSQAQGDLIKWYKFTLKNKNGKVINDFPKDYSYDNNTLTKTINGLEKGVGYILDVEIETMSGLTWSTSEYFVPLYIQPSLEATIDLERDYDNCFVQISSNIKKLTDSSAMVKPSKGSKDNYQYGDSYITAKKDNPVSISNVKVDENRPYYFKTWFKNVPLNSEFIKMKSNYGESVIFTRRENSVVAVKTDKNGVSAYYTSNTLNIVDDKDYMLMVSFIGLRMEILIKEVVK